MFTNSQNSQIGCWQVVCVLCVCDVWCVWVCAVCGVCVCGVCVCVCVCVSVCVCVCVWRVCVLYCVRVCVRGVCMVCVVCVWRVCVICVCMCVCVCACVYYSLILYVLPTHAHTHTHTHNTHTHARMHARTHTAYIDPAAVPAAPSNPTVYLTEEEDGQDTQTAEIAWSADATTNKPIGMLQVKPGTTYTLKVPPQQEEVVMKFTTFGNSKCLNVLPFMGNIQT